jgi:hypothetical protein
VHDINIVGDNLCLPIVLKYVPSTTLTARSVLNGVGYIERETCKANIRCSGAGCTKLPSFNYPGCTPAVFCGRHKDQSMVNVRHKVCQQHGCGTEAKYNHPGATNGAYCGTHKDPGMVRVNSRKCEADGCDRRASFNYNGVIHNNVLRFPGYPAHVK